MTKRIRVERAAIERREPAIIVSDMDGYNSAMYRTVKILGPSVIVQSDLPPGNPKGGKVWIETDAELELE